MMFAQFSLPRSKIKCGVECRQSWRIGLRWKAKRSEACQFIPSLALARITVMLFLFSSPTIKATAGESRWSTCKSSNRAYSHTLVPNANANWETVFLHFFLRFSTPFSDPSVLLNIESTLPILLACYMHLFK